MWWSLAGIVLSTLITTGLTGWLAAGLVDKALHPMKYINQFGPELIIILIIPFAMLLSLQVGLFVGVLARKSITAYVLSSLLVPVGWGLFIGWVVKEQLGRPTMSTQTVWVAIAMCFIVSLATFGREGWKIYQHNKRHVPGANKATLKAFLIIVLIVCLYMASNIIPIEYDAYRERQRLTTAGFNVYNTPGQSLKTDYLKIPFPDTPPHVEAWIKTPQQAFIMARQAKKDSVVKQLLTTGNACDYERLNAYVQINGAKVLRTMGAPVLAACPVVEVIGPFTLLKTTAKTNSDTPYVAVTDTSVIVFHDNQPAKSKESPEVIEATIKSFLRDAQPVAPSQ